MTIVPLPGCATEDEAMAWLAAYIVEQAEKAPTKARDVLRVVLYRGPDGLVRGSAVVR